MLLIIKHIATYGRAIITTIGVAIVRIMVSSRFIFLFYKKGLTNTQIAKTIVRVAIAQSIVLSISGNHSILPSQPISNIQQSH